MLALLAYYTALIFLLPLGWYMSELELGFPFDKSHLASYYGFFATATTDFHCTSCRGAAAAGDHLMPLHAPVAVELEVDKQ